jgi:hypothetical protein
MNQKRITEPKRNTFFAKSALISMLVFCVGTGSAFASGEAADPISTPTITTNVSAEAAVSENKEKTPNLLPGDFFYFIKVVYENIRLSITADDLKEAGLLAEFAQERLSEATALYTKGETEKSKQVLQKSFENQQLAIELVATEAEEENEDKDLKQAVEVKSDLQHNILSLTAALEKVKNPQAQKSLLKNIIKSFSHLEKKLAKLENKAQEEQTSEPLAEQVVVPADANKNTVVSSDAIAASSVKTETEQKTVLNKKTKPEKEAKTKETKSNEAKTNKEARFEKEAKNEKQEMFIKQKKEHENNHNEKNHNNK